MDLTLETWVPSLRCSDAQRTHRKMPNCGGSASVHLARADGRAGGGGERWCRVRTADRSTHTPTGPCCGGSAAGSGGGGGVLTRIPCATIGAAVVAGLFEQVVQDALVARLLAFVQGGRHGATGREGTVSGPGGRGRGGGRAGRKRGGRRTRDGRKEAEERLARVDAAGAGGGGEQQPQRAPPNGQIGAASHPCCLPSTWQPQRQQRAVMAVGGHAAACSGHRCAPVPAQRVASTQRGPLRGEQPRLRAQELPDSARRQRTQFGRASATRPAARCTSQAQAKARRSHRAPGDVHWHLPRVCRRPSRALLCVLPPAVCSQRPTRPCRRLRVLAPGMRRAP